MSHLASGGMGQVYLARATGLGGFERQVVVKTLDLSITDDDDAFVTMFLDEARLVGALHHQYVAPVYEVGCDDEGRYYLVMDYVHGETAEAVFRNAGEKKVPISLAFALTVVSCVASALDYAHNLCAADGTPLEIVHRDISLSNVMIGYDGGIKLIDFGIAKAANRATKTQVGTLKGKIGYLAPEQILRKRVDHRADIFALGIVLYELTTQARAFREASDLITLEKITKGEVKSPSEVVAGYPRELEAIVMRALEVDPDERFQDAGEMGQALEKLAADRGFALGHAPVVDVMGKLFQSKQARRRRLARASNEVTTDPATKALPRAEDEIHEIEPDEDTDVQAGSHRRALKPTLSLHPSPVDASDEDRATLPVRARGTRDMDPLERADEESTPIAEPPPLVAVRFSTPPPLADPSLLDPPTHRDAKPLSRATTGPMLPPPRASSEPFVGRSPTGSMEPMVQRTPTGPILPPPMARPTSDSFGTHDFAVGSWPKPQPEDAPTEIAATLVEREDPTDVSGVSAERRTATAQVARPTPKWGPAYVATAVVSRMRHTPLTRPTDPETLRWLVLCGLFAVAVITAILVAVF